jgi:EAL and modified HD-GYP domain-containing signal transduction protein
MTRARFCESLAPHAGLPKRADDLFLVGMFSLMDAFLDRPISDLLLEVPVNEEIKSAILGEENSLGEVYNYVISYEKGDWPRLSERQARLGIDEIQPPQLYLKALRWGQEAIRG